MLATIFVQPYLKKKITAQSLLPLPWDKDYKKEDKGQVEKSTRERFDELVKKLEQDGK